jgi:hypothetical protein
VEYIINGLLSTKKNEIMLLAGKYVQIDIIMLSNISKTEKDKYHVFTFICGILSLRCLFITGMQNRFC